MMKKIMTLSLCLLFLGVSVAAAAPALTPQTQKTTTLYTSGTFDGNIGYKRQGQNATIVGTINGTLRDESSWWSIHG